MKRRSFLAALFAAPMVPVAAKAIEPPADFVELKGAPLYDPRTDPMIFEDGVLKLQDANIGQVTAGTIRSGNGKMLVDLTNGSIRFS